jgi:hypothetical protein
MPSSATLTAVEYNSGGSVIPAPVLAWLSGNTGVFTVPSAGSGGQTAVVTATGVGSSTGTCTDPSTVVTGSFVVNVSTSLGLVVVPVGTYLAGTLSALAGGGSGLAILGLRMRFLVDCMLGTPTGGELYSINDGSTNTSQEVTFGVLSGTITFNATVNNGTANYIVGTMAQSALPAAGTGVIMYGVYEESVSAFAFVLMTDAGTVLFSNTTVGGPVTGGYTAAGNTSVYLGRSASGSPGGGMTIDGAEVLTALVSAPNTPPLPTDAGAVGLWGFAGVLTPTVVGASLSPLLAGTGGAGTVTYLSGGIWT